MKQVLKILTFSVIVLFGISCEDLGDDRQYDVGDGFVQLNTATGIITEDATDPLITTVQLGSGENSSGVTVDFTVTSPDPSRYTIEPASGTLEIPAGEFTADIALSIVPNIIVDGNIDVTIELTGASVPIGLVGEGNFGVSRVITIVDDDCPIDIDAFVGTFDVSENFTAGVNSPLGLSDFFGEVYQVELSLAPNDPSGTKVVINNSPGFNVYIPDGTVMSFLTCDGEVNFDAGFPTVALFATFAYTASSYDEENGVIQCTGPLANFGDYQFTFTKQ